MKEFKSNKVAVKINDEVVEFYSMTVGEVHRLKELRRSSRSVQTKLAAKYGISPSEVDKCDKLTEEEQEELQEIGFAIIDSVFENLVDKKQRPLVEKLNVSQLTELFEVLREG